MQFVASVAVFCTFYSSCQAEVKLVKGVSQAVAFDGDALLIQLSNPQRQNKHLVVCFSSLTVQEDHCPKGYAGFDVTTNGPQETYKLGGQGVLKWSKGLMDVYGVQFVDGSVNILLEKIPDGATVTLLNAHIPVSITTTTSVVSSKVTSNNTVILILFVSVLVVVVVIVGITAWYFCFCRRKKNQTAAEPAKQLPPKPIRTGQRVDNPKQLSVITTTRTSTSTTKAPEGKPRVNPASKPPPGTPVASKIDCISIRPASTQGSISDSQIR